VRRFVLVCRALCGLFVYDVIRPLCGFERTLRLLGTLPGADVSTDVAPEVCAAVQLATTLYWKRVLCLQRSFCATRLLRAHGVPARLVIGYVPEPFFSHAWVEVAGTVVNDSPRYRQRLRVLYTV
jgi:hypothetical protein